MPTKKKRGERVRVRDRKVTVEINKDGDGTWWALSPAYGAVEAKGGSALEALVNFVARAREWEDREKEQQRLAAGMDTPKAAAEAIFKTYCAVVGNDNYDGIQDAWGDVMVLLKRAGIRTTIHHTCCEKEAWKDTCECGCDWDDYCTMTTALPGQADPVDWDHFNALARERWGEDAPDMLGIP